MAVKIRLARYGAKKRPFYRIVVADARAPRDGKYIESLGFYNPLSKQKKVKINKEKYEEWINKGAQPTDTVRRLVEK